MKKILLFSFLALSLYISNAQQNKWSVELNYPISINNDAYDSNDGAIDLAVKYRFINTGLVHIGIDLNGGFAYDKAGRNNEDTYKAKTYLVQPKLFAEFDLPIAPKLHPMFGLGYSIISNDITGTISGVDFSNFSGADGGFNFDFGFSYDISKRLFAQVKYDIIMLNVKDEVEFNNERVNLNFKENINRIKVGVGYRF